MKPTQIIEALLFASEAPLTAGDMARADESLDEDVVEAAIEQLRLEYEATDRSFQVYEIGGGYRILTRPDYAPYLERFDTVSQTSRVSGAALEVLAIIAYRQPIGRAEVEEIRGIGSAGVLKTLSDRALIEVVGRAEGLGRPLLYGTTPLFLEHFGFRSLEDLPRPDELPVVLKERGAAASEPEAAPEPEAAATEPADAAQADVPASGQTDAPERDPPASDDAGLAGDEQAAALREG
jgi:segregation and condensation protein B